MICALEWGERFANLDVKTDGVTRFLTKGSDGGAAYNFPDAIQLYENLSGRTSSAIIRLGAGWTEAEAEAEELNKNIVGMSGSYEDVVRDMRALYRAFLGGNLTEEFISGFETKYLSKPFQKKSELDRRSPARTLFMPAVFSPLRDSGQRLFGSKFEGPKTQFHRIQLQSPPWDQDMERRRSREYDRRLPTPQAVPMRPVTKPAQVQPPMARGATAATSAPKADKPGRLPEKNVEGLTEEQQKLNDRAAAVYDAMNADSNRMLRTLQNGQQRLEFLRVRLDQYSAEIAELQLIKEALEDKVTELRRLNTALDVKVAKTNAEVQSTVASNLKSTVDFVREKIARRVEDAQPDFVTLRVELGNVLTQAIAAIPGDGQDNDVLPDDQGGGDGIQGTFNAQQQSTASNEFKDVKRQLVALGRYENRLMIGANGEEEKLDTARTAAGATNMDKLKSCRDSFSEALSASSPLSIEPRLNRFLVSQCAMESFTISGGHAENGGAPQHTITVIGKPNADATLPSTTAQVGNQTLVNLTPKSATNVGLYRLMVTSGTAKGVFIDVQVVNAVGGATCP